MTESMCPSLHRLGLLLQAAYRNKHHASKFDLKAIAKAELDLCRVHNLITQHRSSCRHCQNNEALRWSWKKAMERNPETAGGIGHRRSEGV